MLWGAGSDLAAVELNAYCWRRGLPGRDPGAHQVGRAPPISCLTSPVQSLPVQIAAAEERLAEMRERIKSAVLH